MTQRPVIFFDIDGTLASANFREYGATTAERDYIPAGLHLTVFDYIPALLNRLKQDHHAVLGIISNGHQSNYSASERHALRSETLRALEDARLLQHFHPDLIFLSSDAVPGEDTACPFKLAAARAAAMLGVRPQQCVFVGAHRLERGRAWDVGMRPAPHPLVASAVVHDQPLQYLRVDVPDGDSIANLAEKAESLPISMLHHSHEEKYVMLLGTEEAVEDLSQSGLSVQLFRTHANAALLDAFLFCNVTNYCYRHRSSDAPPSGYIEIAKVPDGQVFGLGPDVSMDRHRAVARQGHTVELSPSPCRLYPSETVFPDCADATHAGIAPQQREDIVKIVTAEHMQRYIDRYSGRNPNAKFVTRNRHIRSPDMSEVIDALVADFTAIAHGRLRVSKQPFRFDESLKLYNVEAELRGCTDEIVLITAHLDSTAAHTYGSAYDPTLHDAPGADDDASGIAGVICAAQAFCSLYGSEDPRRTVRFVLFNAEEHGMSGSRHYACVQRAIGANIAAVFQLDMIGYDFAPPPSWEVHTGHCNSTILDQSSLLADAVLTESNQLRAMDAVAVDPPQIFPERIGDDSWDDDPASARSDHASFQDRGYPACAISADFFRSHGAPAERNPHYHKATDTRVSFPYAADLTRCVVAAALSYAR